MVVTSDPSECSFQFNATGTETFTTGCDKIKAALVGLSVNYDNVAAPKGTALPQSIYPVTHPALGLMEIFLVPVGPLSGGVGYQAIFT